MDPVVVVSAYTMGLAVIRALGAKGVPVIAVRYDARDMGHVSTWVREVVDGPHPEEDEERFIEMLCDVAQRYPGSMLVPGCDRSLTVVARHKELLQRAHFVVASPDEGVAATFLDKSATAELAQAAGVAVPSTVVPTTVTDVERYAVTAPFPAILKPTLSHKYYAAFGRKWTRVDNADQAVREYLLAREAGLDVLLQELIPGDELCGANYNSYFCDGVPRVEFTARKIRNSPLESGSPSVAMSSHIPEIIEPGRAILRAAGFQGFSCIEFKMDPRDGVYKLIEVNARHNLSSLLATRCGINFPWLQYRH
ncbi:MAG: hypothetical protein M3332_09165, partial [Actinomycetota bacterium]|nr:hypothetical protein [Actinomycetota bacterium]